MNVSAEATMPSQESRAEILRRKYIEIAQHIVEVLRDSLPAISPSNPAVDVNIQEIANRLPRRTKNSFALHTTFQDFGVKVFDDHAARHIGDAIQECVDEDVVTNAEAEKLRLLLEQKKTEASLQALPEDHRIQVISFVEQVLGVLPAELFKQQNITSRIHIRAIVAATYVILQERGVTVDQEMYIRCLTALSLEVSAFANDSGTTEDALADFLSTATTHNRQLFAIFLTRFMAKTMPISTNPNSSSAPERLESDFAEFSQFMRLTHQYLAEGIGELDRVLGKESTSRPQFIVFVKDIPRATVKTNDPIAESKKDYGSLGAAAITAGEDPITGLPLAVVRLPVNWKSTIQNPAVLFENIAFQVAGAQVHERVHIEGKVRMDLTDWENIINEMLTESVTLELTLRGRGGTLRDFSPGNDLYYQTGYGPVVAFMRGLIRRGVITTDELLAYGLDQDPTGFIDRIVQISQNHEVARTIVIQLIRHVIIEPRYAVDLDATIQQFQADPAGFLEREMMQLARRMSLWAYLAPNTGMVYQQGMLDRINRQHPDYTERMVQRHNLPKGSRSYILLRDPETGFFTPEALAAFYDIYSLGSEESKRFSLGFTDPAHVQRQFRDKLPITINGFTQDQLCQAMLIINSIFRHRRQFDAFYLPSITVPRDADLPTKQKLSEQLTRERFVILTRLAQIALPRVLEVCDRQWGEYDMSEVLALLDTISGTLAESELPREQRGTEQEAAAWLVNQIEAVLAPIDMEGGNTVIPRIPQIIHYIPIANMASSQDQMDLAKAK